MLAGGRAKQQASAIFVMRGDPDAGERATTFVRYFRFTLNSEHIPSEKSSKETAVTSTDVLASPATAAKTVEDASHRLYSVVREMD